MKTGLVALLLVLVGTGTAFADSCLTNTYDNYVGPPSISCTISVNPPGDLKTFSNFSYSTSGSNQMPANQITVNPVAFPYIAGLMFNAPWNVTSGQTQDSLIGFTVTVGSGSPLINDLTLMMFGAGFTGIGSASVSETYCLGDTFADGCAHGTTGTLFTFLNHTGSKLTDTVNFAGVSEVDVMKDVLLSGGDGGTAVLSGIENQFSEVPEPGSLSVLGGGLITMGWLVRRKLSL